MILNGRLVFWYTAPLDFDLCALYKSCKFKHKITNKKIIDAISNIF